MQKKTLLALALLCAAHIRARGHLDPRRRRFQHHHRLDDGHGDGRPALQRRNLCAIPAGNILRHRSQLACYTPGSVFAFGNDQNLALTTDKLYTTAPLTIINTNTSGGIGKPVRNLQLYRRSV